MRVMTIVLCVALFAASVHAADIDGKWQGQIDTPMGSVPVGFVFKADGTTLKGTTTAIDGSEILLQDGRIDGNTIAFKVSLDLGGTSVDIRYKGTISGDRIDLEATFMDMPLKFSVARAK